MLPSRPFRWIALILSRVITKNMVSIKICGITRPEDIQACIENGVRWVGLNFAPPSPRAIAPTLAAELARMAPTGMQVVGVFVNPSDAELENVISQVPLGILQLHGQETPQRVAEIKARWDMPIIKAFAIAEEDDLDIITDYDAVADYYLFDTKLPTYIHALPGGSGRVFDWSVLKNQTISKPWLLAGGITPENAAQAIRITHAPMLDIASGVEIAPGLKDVTKIKALLVAISEPKNEKAQNAVKKKRKKIDPTVDAFCEVLACILQLVILIMSFFRK